MNVEKSIATGHESPLRWYFAPAAGMVQRYKMAKISVVAYLSQDNYHYLHQIMREEHISNESRAIDYIVTAYQDRLQSIADLQRIITQLGVTAPESEKDSETAPESALTD